MSVKVAGRVGIRKSKMLRISHIRTILMYYWNPKRIKELKEKGLKLKFMTLKEANEQVSERASEQALKRPTSERASNAEYDPNR